MTGAVVLISGRGSNLAALLERARDGGLGGPVRAVISNRPDATGLGHARRHGVPVSVLDHRGYRDRAAFDLDLLRAIDAWSPELVVLAGFMRVLQAGTVAHLAGRLLNIHPSLLPRHPGLHTHRRVLAAGDPEHGASVHFVTAEVDGGPVVAQVVLPVLPGDDEAGLAARVLAAEHRLLPLAVEWFLRGRLRLAPGGPRLDGQPVPAGGLRFRAVAEPDGSTGLQAVTPTAA